MTTISASKARNRLNQLINKAAESHIPVTITGNRNDAALISATDWESIQETLYLLSVPGVVQIDPRGIRMPLDACDLELRW